MAETLPTRVFTPRDLERDQDLLLVMPNEVATTLDDYHGARAQDVANTTGYHVLAYERPFSGTQQSYSWRRRQEMLRDSASVFSNTATQLDKAIEREGPKRLYIVGHSAATVDVIGIPHAERTEFNGLIAIDPPCYQEKLRFPELRYGKYQLFVERNKPDLLDDEKSTNIEAATKPTAFQMISRTIGELIVYGKYASSPIPLKNLEDLATKQRQLSISVVFPEHTFTTNREQQIAIKQMLESIRIEEDAFLNVDLLDGEYHSTFDDYKFFGASVLEKVLKSEAGLNG